MSNKIHLEIDPKFKIGSGKKDGEERMNNHELLCWIYDRLVHKRGENKHHYYMNKFQEFIKDYSDHGNCDSCKNWSRIDKSEFGKCERLMSSFALGESFSCKAWRVKE